MHSFRFNLLRFISSYCFCNHSFIDLVSRTLTRSIISLINLAHSLARSLIHFTHSTIHALIHSFAHCERPCAASHLSSLRFKITLFHLTPRIHPCMDSVRQTLPRSSQLILGLSSDLALMHVGDVVTEGSGSSDCQLPDRHSLKQHQCRFLQSSQFFKCH